MIQWEEWGIPFVTAVQAIGSGWRTPAEILSFLGRVDFFLLLLPLVYWCLSERGGLRLGILLTVTHALGLAAKLATTAPRPYWLDMRVAALSHESTYAFPSLHAMLAAAMWPDLGRRAWTRRGAIAGCLLAGLIGASRIILGVHSLWDVLVGFLAGAGTLGLMVWGERALSGPLERAGMGMQWLAAAGGSACILLAQAAILAAIGSFTDPPEWAALAARVGAYDPRDPGYLVLTAGIALGMGAGIACQRRWARFQPRSGAWWTYPARLGLGLAGLLLFYKGLAALLPAGDGWIRYAWQYAQAALSAFWLIFAAPWAFLKLRWVNPGRESG